MRSGRASARSAPERRRLPEIITNPDVNTAGEMGCSVAVDPRTDRTTGSTSSIRRSSAARAYNRIGAAFAGAAAARATPHRRIIAEYPTPTSSATTAETLAFGRFAMLLDRRRIVSPHASQDLSSPFSKSADRRRRPPAPDNPFITAPGGRSASGRRDSATRSGSTDPLTGNLYAGDGRQHVGEIDRVSAAATLRLAADGRARNAGRAIAAALRHRSGGANANAGGGRRSIIGGPMYRASQFPLRLPE